MSHCVTSKCTQAVGVSDICTSRDIHAMLELLDFYSDVTGAIGVLFNDVVAGHEACVTYRFLGMRIMQDTVGGDALC